MSALSKNICQTFDGPAPQCMCIYLFWFVWGRQVKAGICDHVCLYTCEYTVLCRMLLYLNTVLTWSSISNFGVLKGLNAQQFTWGNLIWDYEKFKCIYIYNNIYICIYVEVLIQKLNNWNYWKTLYNQMQTLHSKEQYTRHCGSLCQTNYKR